MVIVKVISTIIKKLKFEKVVGITIKSKETRSNATKSKETSIALHSYS